MATISISEDGSIVVPSKYFDPDSHTFQIVEGKSVFVVPTEFFRWSPEDNGWKYQLDADQLAYLKKCRSEYTEDMVNHPPVFVVPTEFFRWSPEDNGWKYQLDADQLAYLKKCRSEYTEDMVNHPPHYSRNDEYEPIKVIDAWKLSFCLGNTVKYIARAGKKDSTKELEDLKKARWYLDHHIEQMEKQS